MQFTVENRLESSIANNSLLCRFTKQTVSFYAKIPPAFRFPEATVRKFARRVFSFGILQASLSGAPKLSRELYIEPRRVHSESRGSAKPAAALVYL